MTRAALRLVACIVAVTCCRSAAAQSLTVGEVDDTILAVGATIEREYFDPQIGKQVHDALREGVSEGRFPNLDTANDLANTLNRELYLLTHDKHLAVAVIRTTPTGSPATDQDRADAARRDNGGVRQVEILPGNVGYLDLSYFWRPAEADDAIATAMHALRNADAIIFDMRMNGGGSPETIATLIGYLFDQPDVPLFDIVPRTGAADQYRTPSTVSMDANGHRPVYVLTAARTFSGGEGFAFLLQERKRAEVIGEVTAGAANPGRPYPVNDRFEVVVPNGQVRSAVGGGNWEGKGVTPDIQVPAADALRVAQERALLSARSPR